MTPEQLRQLRDSLPAFAGGEINSRPFSDYCRFYGIDFTGRYPGLEHQAGAVRSGPYALSVHFWQRPGACSNLLLLHGYFDHTGLYNKLIEYGLSRNCNVLIFDLPGHGLSTGEAAVIDNFSDYSRAIVNVLAAVKLPDLPLWVMGQSTGCAALVDYAWKTPWPFAAVVLLALLVLPFDQLVEHGPGYEFVWERSAKCDAVVELANIGPFAAVVLLAPLVRPVGWLRVRVAHTLLRRFVDSIPRKFNENSSDRAFLEFIQNDPLQCDRVSLRWIGALRRWLRRLPKEDLRVGPALVIQGDADGTVDWRHNMQVVSQLFPASRVVYLPGAGHQLANESGELLGRYLEVVDEWVGRAGLFQAGRSTVSEQYAAADGALDGGQLGQGDVAVLRVDVDDHVAD